MSIAKTNQETLEARIERAYITISRHFIDHQVLFIRRQYDAAATDDVACACIKLAKDMEMDALAEELEADYRREVGND